jgi:hypothetical protein
MRLAPLAPPIVLLAGVLLLGCGGKDTPAAGRLEVAGTRAHLIVEGTPREQGLAQGRLLRNRIHAFHEAWHKALLAPGGDLLAPAVQERKRGLLALLGPARRHLPESARQELAGLAEGCGLPEPTLLLSEMLTDLLRFSEPPSPLVAGRVERSGEAKAWLTLEGPLAPLLRERLVWITRRASADVPAVTVLTWPGSLGGLLAARADGLALLALEEALEPGRQGLAGVPFDLSLRLAAERATDAQDALGLLSTTTAHRVVALDLARRTGLEALVALTGEDAVESPLRDVDTRVAQYGVERDADGVWLIAEPVPNPGGSLPISRVRVP